MSTGKSLFTSLKEAAVTGISLAAARLREIPSEGYDGAEKMAKHGSAELGAGLNSHSNAFVQYGHDTLKIGPQQSRQQEQEHER